MLALFFHYCLFPFLFPTDDHSRVVLSHLDGHPCSDYINASYIDVNLGCGLNAYTSKILNVFRGEKTKISCSKFVFPRRGLKRKINLLQLKVNI